MIRFGLAFVLVTSSAICFGQSTDRQQKKQACVEELSSFAIDPKVAERPQLPTNLEGVALEYFSSGCYGNCPSFTMRVEKDRAVWEGRAFVRKKKKIVKAVSPEVLQGFLKVWLDDSLYAMRDEYCNPKCPDGTLIIVSDLNETEITLKSSSYVKKVSECAVKSPIEPRPPAQYFDLEQKMREFAQANRWY